MFIQRDWNRSEHDDFALNVQGKISHDEGAMPIYLEDGTVAGWKIAPLYE